jgi:hypothetical protein
MKNSIFRISLLLGAAAAMLGTGCMRARAAGDARAERIVAQARERFAAADLDRDGLLTRDEAAKGMPRVAGHFDEIDSSHAGKVSLEQILRFVASRHERDGAD